MLKNFILTVDYCFQGNDIKIGRNHKGNNKYLLVKNWLNKKKQVFDDH
jgi:hypothetical protein